MKQDLSKTFQKKKRKIILIILYVKIKYLKDKKRLRAAVYEKTDPKIHMLSINQSNNQTSTES